MQHLSCPALISCCARHRSRDITFLYAILFIYFHLGCGLCIFFYLIVHFSDEGYCDKTSQIVIWFEFLNVMKAV